MTDVTGPEEGFCMDAGFSGAGFAGGKIDSLPCPERRKGAAHLRRSLCFGVIRVAVICAVPVRD